MKRILVLFLLISSVTFAQQRAEVDLSNPKATVYTHIYFLQSDSYEPEKSAATIYGKESDEAVDIAIKIKRVLDGKGLVVDFNKIPADSMYLDTLGYTTQHKYILFPELMPLISVEKVGNSWYYSEETLQNIEMLHDDIFPWYVDRIQEVIPGAGHRKIFNIELWQYALILVLILATVLVFWISKRLVFVILRRILFRYTKNKFGEINQSLKKLAHPIALLIALTLVDKITPSIQLGLEVNKWLFTSINIARTVFWVYVFLKLAEVLVSFYHRFTEKTESKLDDQLIPIVRAFLIVVIVIVGIFKMLLLLGVDAATIIAGASIGGLAIALASQDTVKNFLGTIVIFLDQPFQIGDWIEGGGVVGTVEEVGFRSTRIRAADTSVYQIPNSKLTEIVINNSGLRLFRRYNTTFGLRYDTPPELIDAFTKGVKEIVLAHPDSKKDAVLVEFVEFGSSSLNVMLNMYFHNTAWGAMQESKHQIHIAIIRLAKDLGVDFAFPSTTMMIEQTPDKSIDLGYNTSEDRANQVIEKTVQDFKDNLPSTED